MKAFVVGIKQGDFSIVLRNMLDLAERREIYVNIRFLFILIIFFVFDIKDLICSYKCLCICVWLLLHRKRKRFLIEDDWSMTSCTRIDEVRWIFVSVCS